VFLSIIREQFKLMQAWMQPLMSSTQKNTKGLKNLEKQIDAAMKGYEKLIGKLEDTE